MADGSLSEIEDKVERSRIDLADTLDRLAATLSPENLSDTVQGYGGELGRQAWRTARTNPAALALIGAGAALMLSGTGARAEHPRPTRQSVPPQDAMRGFDDRVARADAAMRAGAATVRPSASRLSKGIERGLDKLPAAARQRVLRARRAAILAQEAVEHHAARVAQASSRLVEEQPLAVGAVAFGIGALIAAALPGTQREDAMLGARRDALMTRAGALLRAELGRQQADGHLFDHDEGRPTR